MVTKEIRKIRCSDTLDFLLKNNLGLCFITLTTPDVCDLQQIRERWRNLRHHLSRKYSCKGFQFHYVMNYELHPGGHGWHVHAVFNRYINLRNGGLHDDIRRFGFGSVNVQKVYSKGVSEYLSKHCMKAYRGTIPSEIATKRFRLVNTSRGLPTLDSYSWHSEYNKRRNKILNSLPEVFTGKSFRYKFQVAELAVIFDCSAIEVLKRLHEYKKDLKLKKVTINQVPLL